jgi:hypothetical protein
MVWISEESGFDSRKEQEIFLLSVTFRQTLWPTHPPIERVPAAVSRVKRLGREADHSSPSRAEVKNGGAVLLLPINLLGLVLN